MREDPHAWPAARRKIVKIRQDYLDLFAFVNRRSPVQTRAAARHLLEGSERCRSSSTCFLPLTMVTLAASVKRPRTMMHAFPPSAKT